MELEGEINHAYDMELEGENVRMLRKYLIFTHRVNSKNELQLLS